MAPAGHALGRRLARGHACARGGGLDRDDLARGGRRARAHPRRRRARRGGPRLPLAPALALPALVQDDRLRARALRRARAPGTTPPADRARRAHVLPGLLRAGGGQRPRVADDAGRSLTTTASSSTATRSGRRARGSPTGSTSPSARTRTSRGTVASPCSSHRSTRRGSRCAASRHSAAATSARCSSTASRSQPRTSSAS